MKTKELSEIKKTLHIKKTYISRIAGCYIDGEKNMRCEIKDAFWSLEEDERLKYLELFKKGLTGKQDKNLYDLSVDTDSKPTQLLKKLVDSELKDEELLREFYTSVIEHYKTSENYYVVLAYGAYDIPSKVQDDSEYVYSHIICMVCPMYNSESRLGYQNNTICRANRNLLVENPKLGFIYPSFNDRNTDINNVWLYIKKETDMDESFVENILGSVKTDVISSKKKVEKFSEVLNEKIGKDLGYETVSAICTNLHENVVQSEDKEEYTLDVPETTHLLVQSGIQKEVAEEVAKEFKEQAKSVKGCVIDNKSLKIKAGDVSITAPMDKSDYISVQDVDGKKSIVITLTDSEIIVNGIASNQSL